MDNLKKKFETRCTKFPSFYIEMCTVYIVHFFCTHYGRKMLAVLTIGSKSTFKYRTHACYFGVPQGSWLCSLFFLIFINNFINDLPYFLDLSRKLFADDTTLYLTGDDINQLQKDFSKRASDVIFWCEINRLDIDWKKTFAMIITNKRVIIPKEILNHRIPFQVVDSFRLLWVTIDRKLSFVDHVSNVFKSVNQNLFWIKSFSIWLEVTILHCR